MNQNARKTAKPKLKKISTSFRITVILVMTVEITSETVSLIYYMTVLMRFLT